MPNIDGLAATDTDQWDWGKVEDDEPARRMRSNSSSIDEDPRASSGDDSASEHVQGKDGVRSVMWEDRGLGTIGAEFWSLEGRGAGRDERIAGDRRAGWMGSM